MLPQTSICLEFYLNNRKLFNKENAPFGFVLMLFSYILILFKSLRGPPSPSIEKRVKGDLQEEKSLIISVSPTQCYNHSIFKHLRALASGQGGGKLCRGLYKKKENK